MLSMFLCFGFAPSTERSCTAYLLLLAPLYVLLPLAPHPLTEFDACACVSPSSMEQEGPRGGAALLSPSSLNVSEP